MIARRLVAALFGVAMTAAATAGAGTPGLAAAAVGLVAVPAGLYLRAAATAAVLAAVCAVALTEPHPMLAAASGVCATAYLVLTYATLTRPMALGIIGFAAVGALATTAPVAVPWLPLLAPVAVVAVVGIVLSPFFDIPQPTGTGSAATTSGATTGE